MSAEAKEIIFTRYQDEGDIHRQILELPPFHPSRIRYSLALSLLPQDLTGLKIIDFGGGDGAMSTLVADRGAKVVVVDSDRLALQMAKNEDSRLSAAQSKSVLPFKSESVDAIVMLETLEHIRDSEEMLTLNEANRVLKPEGTFVISVPSSNLAVTKFHYRHYSIDELRDKLTNTGFKVKEEIFYRERLRRFAGKPLGKYVRGLAYGLNWAANNFTNYVRCSEKEATGFILLAGK